MKALMVVYIAVLCISVFGWGNNIYKLTKCDFEVPVKAELIRSVGIFVAPVGVVAGYMSIDGE